MDRTRMNLNIGQQIRRLTAKVLRDHALPITWHRRAGDSWLEKNLPTESFRAPHPARMSEIESIAAEIEALGPQPLWEKYRRVYDADPDVPFADAAESRSVGDVRTQPMMGCFFAWLVRQRRPDLVVEFGTAFGISGMYWASGLDEAGNGRLLTFEPNEVWNTIASGHLRAFSERVVPVLGTFEDNIDRYRDGETIDIGFVDAIHTDEFVTPQVEMLVERLTPGGLIVLDDISFSGDMRACWERWAEDARVTASVALDARVGVLEMRA
jgi:predicted O-methyltransferase YrrM